MNFRNLTRLRVIQAWFAAVLVVVVGAVALGVAVTMGTAALLVAVCLVPPVVVFVLWPSDDAPTMAETIRDAKVR